MTKYFRNEVRVIDHELSIGKFSIVVTDRSKAEGITWHDEDGIEVTDEALLTRLTELFNAGSVDL